MEENADVVAGDLVGNLLSSLEIADQNRIVSAPTGPARTWAATTLRVFVEAATDHNSVPAASFLDQAQPASPGGSTPETGTCAGLTLQLLDDWLSGRADGAPTDFGQRVRLPDTAWSGERTATDIVTPARKGRALRSGATPLDPQGGMNVLDGSAGAGGGCHRLVSSLGSRTADLAINKIA
ncbi:hypothetical protein [Nonomuraea sp. NPDC050786]|uniref:hypothetical protein n=1 Tax=Nonomuraea sp. NPDC050786 TaxID=3154840 RepID=UPI0033F6D7BD